MKLIILCLAFFSFCSNAGPIVRYEGLFEVGADARRSRVELNGVKTLLSLDLQEFAPQTLRLLQNFDGLPVQIKTIKNKLEWLEFRGDFNEHVAKAFILKDGLLTSGKILSHRSVYYMQLHSVNGRKQIKLEGEVLKSPYFREMSKSLTVEVEGILREDAKTLEVTKIKNTADRSEMGKGVLLSGQLHKGKEFAYLDQQRFFIEGPNGRRGFLKTDEDYNPLLGSHVVVFGRDLMGGVSVESMIVADPMDTTGCATNLLNQVLSDHQRFKTNR